MHYLGNCLWRGGVDGIPQPVQLGYGRTAVLDRSRFSELAQSLPGLHDAHPSRFLHRLERVSKIAEGLGETLVGSAGVCRRLEALQVLRAVAKRCLEI
jgi:hypothetical protein